MKNKGATVRREITLQADTRVFTCVEGNSLTRTGTHLKAGERILVSEAKNMDYAHRLQPAISFQMSKETYFLLVGELDPSHFD